jgi:cob(I)alamin adenosyltransferase
MAVRIVLGKMDRLESVIDALTATLSPLTSFILPGGEPAAAHLHLARAIVRRAERKAVEAAAGRSLNPLALTYLNRLSDHLFTLCRVINGGGARDVLWKPGSTRAV